MNQKDFSKPVADLCNYPSCQRMAKYALYRLYPNFTKKWINVCAMHDHWVAFDSNKLRELYPEVIFKEIY